MVFHKPRHWVQLVLTPCLPRHKSCHGPATRLTSTLPVGSGRTLLEDSALKHVPYLQHCSKYLETSQQHLASGLESLHCFCTAREESRQVSEAEHTSEQTPTMSKQLQLVRTGLGIDLKLALARYAPSFSEITFGRSTLLERSKVASYSRAHKRYTTHPCLTTVETLNQSRRP